MTAAARIDARTGDLADRIARDIQSGHYGPGTWLKQIDLESRYGETRINVRRALDKLVLKRLVEHVPNRGYHVRTIDMAHVLELREVVIILESAAAEEIVAEAKPAGIAALRRRAQAFADLLDSGTLLDLYDANRAFHTTFSELCPNRELGALIRDCRSRGPSAPLTQWRSHARIERSAREHFLMVEAIEARDAARLKRLIAAHVRQGEGEGA
jgi:DNA-binding GntR family transcriptional regulator